MKSIPIALSLVFFLFACKNEAPPPEPPPAGLLDVQEVVGIAIIEPAARIVGLSAEQGGRVRALRADVGARLKKGQPILELDAAVEQAQAAQANARIATQQDAVKTALENLRILQVKLQKTERDLVRDRALLEKNALTQQEFDNALFAVDDLRQQASAQEAAMRQEQTRAGELRAELAYFQTLLRQKSVRAPADGILLSLDAKVGQYLDTKNAFGEFAPAGPVIALTEIDELFADRVRVGQRAYIRPQGKTDTLSTGVVVLTSPYLRKKSLFSDNPSDLEDRRVREVRVQLDQPDKVLLGARVECVVLLGN